MVNFFVVKLFLKADRGIFETTPPPFFNPIKSPKEAL